MKWDINVSSAGTTIENAALRADDYGDVGTKIDGIAQGAAGTLQYSPPVAQALGEYLRDALGPDFSTVTGHTANALTKTTEAVQHYINGDQEQAAHSQSGLSQVKPSSAPGMGGK